MLLTVAPRARFSHQHSPSINLRLPTSPCRCSPHPASSCRPKICSSPLPFPQLPTAETKLCPSAVSGWPLRALQNSPAAPVALSRHGLLPRRCRLSPSQPPAFRLPSLRAQSAASLHIRTEVRKGHSRREVVARPGDAQESGCAL